MLLIPCVLTDRLTYWLTDFVSTDFVDEGGLSQGIGGCQAQALRRRAEGLTLWPLPLWFVSWQFTCINLWDTCLCHSEDLQSSLANTPLLAHRIDIRPVVPEAGLLYVDEIILADTNVTGDHRICSSLGPVCQMPVSDFHMRDCSLPLPQRKEWVIPQLGCLGLKADEVESVCPCFYVSLASFSVSLCLCFPPPLCLLFISQFHPAFLCLYSYSPCYLFLAWKTYYSYL